MVFRYINRTGSHTFNTDLGSSVVRLGSIAGLVGRASLGENGTGGLELDDPAGTLLIKGLQEFQVSENLIASPDDVIWRGYIGDRTVERGDGSRPSLITGAARMWSMDLMDGNFVLTARKIRDSDGKRGAEAAHVRLAWALGLAYCPVNDYGDVSYPSHQMSKTDYTGQTFGQVFADVAAAVSYNYWVRWSVTNNGYGLWFNDPDGTAYSTTARLSNILGDIDQTRTFEVLSAKLNRRASRVASGAMAAYNGGTYYAQNPTTADLFTRFDQDAPMGSVTTLAAAQANVIAYLAQSAEEDDLIEVRYKVPAAHVNDIREGQRMQARFSHLPTQSNATGYATFTWFRVVDRAVAQDEEDDSQYNVTVNLSPQSTGLYCALDGSISATASGTFPALGSALTDSRGNIWYSNSNANYFADSWTVANGPRPNTGLHGLGFPAYAVTGGDAGGVNVNSVVAFVFVGSGTISASWVNYDGTYDIGWSLLYDSPTGYNVAEQSGTLSAPGTLNVTVGDLPADAVGCYRVLTMQINHAGAETGSKGTFASVTWALSR